MVKRIYMKAYKDPFHIASPKEVYKRNLIGDNVGNLLYSNASYKLLDTQDATLATGLLEGGAEEAARINAEFDHVVIPLANAFRPSYVRQLGVLTEAIRKLTVPVTVLGVGAQMNLSGDAKRLEPIRQQVKEFVSAVLDRSPSIGVRGQRSADYLADLGFHDVRTIGCPSLFMRGPELRVTSPQTQLAADAKVSLNISPYVKGIAALVEANARAYRNLRYTAQHRGALGMLLTSNTPAAAAGEDPLLPTVSSHQLVASRRTSFFVDPTPWLTYLADFDFSFGTRIHGNIAAILAGTPAYVIAHDSRTLELARYHDIPHVSVKEIGAQTRAQELFERADYDVFNTRQSARFHTFSAYLHEHQLLHAYDPGQDPDAFERKAASLTYPGDVGQMRSSRELSLRQAARRWLKR